MRHIRNEYIRQCSRSSKSDYTASLKRLPEDPFGLEGVVSELRLYPGKALGALLVDKVIIGPSGLQTPEGLQDRSFMLGKRNPKTGEAGAPSHTRFSQRQMPQLDRVTPHFDGKILTYEAPGMQRLEIDLEELQPRNGEQVTVEPAPETIMPAVRENGPITARLREYMGQFREDIDEIDVLLPSKDAVRSVESRHRRSQNAQTVFSDGGQILLASESSLAFVQEYIDRRLGSRALWYTDARQVPMSAFRPNIVVSGWPANLEDILDHATIEGTLPVNIGDVQEELRGHLILLFGDLSVRCKVTEVDPATGAFAGDGEPMTALRTARPLRLDGSKVPTFGVNVVAPQQMWGGSFAKGDTIEAGGEKQVEKQANGA